MQRWDKNPGPTDIVASSPTAHLFADLGITQQIPSYLVTQGTTLKTWMSLASKVSILTEPVREMSQISCFLRAPVVPNLGEFLNTGYTQTQSLS